ncbi:MAG: hypothetical protein ABI383_11780 [Acidobacteriaceae bacterium]
MSSINDKSQSDTLQVGDAAPGFQLIAANFVGAFSLDKLLVRGAVIVEFLRGTW